MKRLFVLSTFLFIALGTAIYVRMQKSAERISEKFTVGSSIEAGSDIFLLASLIEGESFGKSYTAQVAVGAVILNRLKSPFYPDTISSVIYQPGAFRSVTSGSMNLPSQASINAAKDALNGWDPTYGALDILSENYP